MALGPLPGGAYPTLNVTANTVIATTPAGGPKRVLHRIVVTVAGAAGAVYDNASTSTGNTAANLIAVVPATVGVVDLEWPCSTGITYIPGAAQVANFSWD